jgi:hypothetical protein
MPGHSATSHSFLDGVATYLNSLKDSVLSATHEATIGASTFIAQTRAAVEPVLQNVQDIGKSVRDIGYLGSTLSGGRAKVFNKAALAGEAMVRGPDAIRTEMEDRHRAVLGAAASVHSLQGINPGNITRPGSVSVYEQNKRKQNMKKKLMKKKTGKTPPKATSWRGQRTKKGRHRQ